MIKLTKEFFNKIGTEIKQKIKSDAAEGIYQDDGSPKPYSKRYANKKKYFMKHHTVAKKDTKKRKKGDIILGKNFEEYKGISIKSNQISPPNMYLTGHLLDSIKVIGSNTGTEIKFQPADAEKIISNIPLGRNVFGLNKKNFDLVSDKVFEEVNKIFTSDFLKK